MQVNNLERLATYRTEPKPARGIAGTPPAPFPLMTPYEQEFLEKYLAYLNGIGHEGDYPDFEAWYQAVRYAQGPGAPITMEEASELRCQDVLKAVRVFNRLRDYMAQE